MKKGGSEAQKVVDVVIIIRKVYDVLLGMQLIRTEQIFPRIKACEKER